MHRANYKIYMSQSRLYIFAHKNLYNIGIHLHIYTYLYKVILNYVNILEGENS